MKKATRVLVLLGASAVSIFTVMSCIFYGATARLASSPVFYTVFIYKSSPDSEEEWMRGTVCILNDHSYQDDLTENVLRLIAGKHTAPLGPIVRKKKTHAENEWYAGNLSAVGFTAPGNEVCDVIKTFYGITNFETSVYDATELIEPEGKFRVEKLPNCNGIPLVKVVRWQ